MIPDPSLIVIHWFAEMLSSTSFAPFGHRMLILLDRRGVAKTKVTPKVRLRREARSASHFIHKAQSFGFDNHSSANRASI